MSFDIEDFVNHISLISLKRILLLLKTYSIKSIFFITGHMAEKLQKYPSILDMLKEHEIGYHSSSHTVRPTIPEFTDTKNYSTAVKNSLERETSYIDPIKGNIEREGGIISLNNIFKNKRIIYFRAPGLCWTPPHLEAMKKLGIEYNFSSQIYGKNILQDDILFYKGMSFFPQHYYIKFSNPYNLDVHIYNVIKLLLMFYKKNICYNAHEWDFIFNKPWDSFYYNPNPENLKQNNNSYLKILNVNMNIYNLYLKILSKLKNKKIIHLTTDMNELTIKNINGNDVNIEKTYYSSINWSLKYLNYKPKYLYNHFYTYFKN